MSRTPVTYQQLIAFAAGELDEAAARPVRAWIRDHPDAAETVARYRAVHEAVRDDDAVDAPPEAVARAKAIFRPDPRAKPSDLIEGAIRAVASLIFDSRAQLVPGVRGRTAGFQLTYSLPAEAALGDAQLDLEAEIADDAGDGTWRLIGQVAAPKETPRFRASLCRAGTHEAVAAADADDRGAFVLPAAPGAYDLHLHLPAGATVVPDIVIA